MVTLIEKIVITKDRLVTDSFRLLVYLHGFLKDSVGNLSWRVLTINQNINFFLLAIGNN